MRVTTQLIDAITGEHLWADRYDRNVGDLFAVKDDITLNIVANIGGELTLSNRDRLTRRQTESLEAWLLAREGVAHHVRFSPTDIDFAREKYEQALAIDPDFAVAMAWLADTYRVEGQFRYVEDPRTALETAREIIVQAMAIDEDLAVVQAVRGTVHLAHFDVDTCGRGIAESCGA